MFGVTYNYLGLNLDTDVVLNEGGRLATSTANFKYKVKRDETAHFVEFRLKQVIKNSFAMNYKLAYRMTHDKLDNELSKSIPTVTERDIDEYRLTVSPEFWIFNRMKVAVATGVATYDLSEKGAPSINVGGNIIKASPREYKSLTWFIGMNVDILF